jgi:hypothetical protein
MLAQIRVGFLSAFCFERNRASWAAQSRIKDSYGSIGYQRAEQKDS